MIKKRNRPQPRIREPSPEVPSKVDTENEEDEEEQLPCVIEIIDLTDWNWSSHLQSSRSDRTSEIEESETRDRCGEIE